MAGMLDYFRNKHRTRSDPPAHHAKKGRKFTFHGSFTSKADAVRKERATPGSFIREKGGRYTVMTENK